MTTFESKFRETLRTKCLEGKEVYELADMYSTTIDVIEWQLSYVAAEEFDKNHKWDDPLYTDVMKKIAEKYHVTVPAMKRVWNETQAQRERNKPKESVQMSRLKELRGRLGMNK